MAKNKSKRSPSGAPTTKWFITAASIAAVIGGWVGFSLQSPNGSDSNYSALTVNLELDPIPSVVAPPEQSNLIWSDNSVANSQTNQPVYRTVNTPRPTPVAVTRSSR